MVKQISKAHLASTWATIVLAIFIAAATLSPSVSAASETPAVIDYGKLPLIFEANRGQTDERVKFLSRGRGYSLFLTESEAVLSLQGVDDKGQTLRMKLLGAEAAPKMTGLDRLPGVSNYFIGRDRSKWRTGVPHYARVGYKGVYPGIDLEFYGTDQRRLEYDFVVTPGADPDAIALNFEGAERLEIDDSGDLVATLSGGQVRFLKPVIYQEEGGTRQSVAGGYALKDGRVTFDLAAYDRSKPLVIDPVLAYATYLGGGNTEDRVRSIAVDSAGNAYTVGRTLSTNFPIVGGIQDTCVITAGYDDCHDAFVVKLDATGSNLVYSTYLGGAAFETAWAVAADDAGNAYVGGQIDQASIITNDFPTTLGAFQEEAISVDDAFFVKLDTGGALAYSTYLGGSRGEIVWDIAVDPKGRAVIGGETGSNDFPTTEGAFDRNCGEDDVDDTIDCGYTIGDAFLVVIDPAGKGADDLIYSTFLGGHSNDYGTGVAADGAGLAYVTGFMGSSDFPTSDNAFQAEFTGGQSFLVVIDPDAIVPVDTLIYSTFLGGVAGPTIARDVAVKPGCVLNCAAYITGQTSADDFPTTPDSFAPYAVTEFNTFVTVIDPFNDPADPDDDLIYSTFFGGSGGWAIAVDSAGKAYVSGRTVGLSLLPTTQDATQPIEAGSLDGFLAVFDPADATVKGLRFATYLGGSGQENTYAVAAGGSGTEGDPFAAYMAGMTNSSDFPATAGAFQTQLSRGKGKKRGSGTKFDAFIAKIQGPFDNTEPVDTPNFKPTAVADDYTTTDNVTLTVPVETGLLDNDSDPDGGPLDPLVVSANTNPANGWVVVGADGSFEYTPDPDFFGTDTFRYTASDGQSSDNAYVTIEVEATSNHPPVADDDSYSLFNAPADVFLDVGSPGVLGNDSDSDGNPLTVSLIEGGGPQNGTVVLLPVGGFTYTPEVGFFGADWFTYQAEDDNGGVSNAATATIAVSDGTLHLGQLHGTISRPKAPINWTVAVSISLHHGGSEVPSKERVTFDLVWQDSLGNSDPVTCTTTYNCYLLSKTFGRTVSWATLTVIAVPHDVLAYDPADNHDPEGGIQDGETSITFFKPF